MPSIWPARPPPCRRTRSPIRNGRAAIRTMPAIRLPSVCWAARPKTTAVMAPPTASVRGSRPAIRSAENPAIARNESRMRKLSGARGAGVDAAEQPRLGPAAEVARQRPAEHHEDDRGSDARGRVDAEDLLAPDVGRDRQPRAAGRSAAARAARGGRAASVCSVIERARAAGALASKRGFWRARSMSMSQHCPVHRVSSPAGSCDRGHSVVVPAIAGRGRAQNSVVCRAGSGAGLGGASAGGGRSKRGATSRPLRRRRGSRAVSSSLALLGRYAPLRYSCS